MACVPAPGKPPGRASSIIAVDRIPRAFHR